jgi:hypothetical protein
MFTEEEIRNILPANWGSLGADQKAQFFKDVGISTDNLVSLGVIKPEDTAWFAERGVAAKSNIPTFTDQMGFQEDSGTVVRSAKDQQIDWLFEQARVAQLTPAQRAIESARYTESLDGGNETRYNPVNFQGRDWLVGPSGDNLVTMSTDQSGLSGNNKRYDVLDPITGQVSQVVSEDRSMWQRFVSALPQIALGAAAVIGGPALLEAAGGLFGGGAGAAELGGLGALGEGAGAAGAGAGTVTGAGALGGTAVGAGTGAGVGAGTAATGAATGVGVGAGTAATGAATGAASTVFNPASLFTTAANTVLQGLTNTNAQNVLGSLISSGANLAMIQDAADKLRQQGKLTQTEYTNLANQLGGQYDAAGAAARLGQVEIAEGILPYTQTLGSTAQQGLMNVGQTAANMVGQFTPYGVTGSLFGTTYDPKTGQVNTALTEDARAGIYNPLAQSVYQSINAANMTDVDQLSQDYYNKLTALSAPEIERQRLATEARLRAQGRLGVSGSAFGGSSPELLAQEQAIARQQLERELQSRQAALGERGTLLSQGTAALAPIQQLTQQEMAQAQLSGQLGQLAQQGRISAAGLFAQPAAQGYMTQAQTGLAGQQLAANAQQAGVQQQLAAQLAGLNAQSNLRSLGLEGNLQAQQEALAGLLNSRRDVANQILGNQGTLGGIAGNLLGGLLNPSITSGYDQATLNALGQSGAGVGYGGFVL